MKNLKNFIRPRFGLQNISVGNQNVEKQPGVSLVGSKNLDSCVSIDSNTTQRTSLSSNDSRLELLVNTSQTKGNEKMSQIIATDSREMTINYETLNGTKTPSLLISVRFLLSILMFFGISIQYAHKSDISVAIVCMVNHTALDGKNNKSSLETTFEYEPLKENSVPCYFANSSAHRDPDGQFVWSKSIQEFILSSYFYGYILSQIPGGWLAYKFGPKKVFLVSMFLGSIGTILVPVCANWGYGYLILCRFLTGVVQGVMWPTMMGMWSFWAPTHEKSILIGLANSGSQIGSIIGFAVGGYLCQHGGWQSIFYSFGIAGMFWCVFWMFLTSDTPDKNRFISTQEKVYIKNETQSNMEGNKVKKTPWIAIITSKVMIALFLTHFCQCWGVVLFLTNAPIYMKEVLKFDIKSNGALLSIPYLATLLAILISGYISDLLIKRFKYERCKVRKFFNGFGFIIPACLMVVLSYIGCDKPYIGVLVLTLGLSLSGVLCGGGFLITYNEVSGSYSGITYGISNTIASSTGIFVPYLVAAVTEKQTQEEWRIVFFVTAGVYIFGAFVSLLFGSSKLQPWAENDKINDEQINE